MATALSRRKTTFPMQLYDDKSEDDRNPISKVPVPTMASDVDRNPVPYVPVPMMDSDSDIDLQALSLSPDRDHSPEPRQRVRFNLESNEFDQRDSDLDLTPTKLNRVTTNKPSTVCKTRNLQLLSRELNNERKSAGRFASIYGPMGAICNVSQTSDGNVPNLKRGIKVPFSILGPIASAPEQTKQYTVHDHTLGVKTQKELRVSKQTPSKGRKPVVSKVLGLQKHLYAQKSPSKASIQRYTNYGTNCGSVSKYNKPELHSTLKLARSMQKLQVAKVDAKAELRKMMKDEELAQRVMQKASLPVNIPFTEKQYKDLTPVDVATGDVVAKLLKDQETKIKSLQPSPRPKDQVPDLMEFYDDSIYHEAPSWAIYFPPVSLDSPVTAPSDCAYSQYRRLRMWENDDS